MAVGYAGCIVLCSDPWYNLYHGIGHCFRLWCDDMSPCPVASVWTRSQQRWWIVAHVIAGTLGVTILRVALGVSDWLVFGLVFGCTQWLLLRHHLRGSGWWVLASILGGMAGMVINQALELAGLFQNNLISYPISGLVYGAALGFGQWLLMGRWFVRANRWVLTNAVAGGSGVALAGVINRAWVFTLGEVGDGVAAWAIFGLVYGLLTNRMLVYLFEEMTSRS